MSARVFGARPRKRAPDFRSSLTAFSWEGTAAITQAGRAATIQSVLAVHESATMVAPWFLMPGQTSAQYFVQATTRWRLPIASRITVALGCKETIRCGLWSGDMIDQSYKVRTWEAEGEERNVASNVSSSLRKNQVRLFDKMA